MSRVDVRSGVVSSHRVFTANSVMRKTTQLSTTTQSPNPTVVGDLVPEAQVKNTYDYTRRANERSRVPSRPRKWAPMLGWLSQPGDGAPTTWAAKCSSMPADVRLRIAPMATDRANLAESSARFQILAAWLTARGLFVSW